MSNKINKFLNSSSLIELSLSVLILLGTLYLYLDKLIFKSVPLFLMKYYTFDFISRNYVYIGAVIIVISALIYYVSSIYKDSVKDRLGNENNPEDNITDNSFDTKKFLYAFSRNPLLFESKLIKKFSEQDDAINSFRSRSSLNNDNIASIDGSNDSSNVEINSQIRDKSSILKIARIAYGILLASILVLHIVLFANYYKKYNDYFLTVNKVYSFKNKNGVSIEIPYTASELPTTEQKNKVTKYWLEQDSLSVVELKKLRKIIIDFQDANLEMQIEKINQKSANNEK